MFFSKKEYEVRPNTTGYLFRNHVLEQQLSPGFHEIRDQQNRTMLICLPDTPIQITAVNQEVLTRDNVALRFSFTLLYRITEGRTFLSAFALDKRIDLVIQEAEQRLSTLAQGFLRNRIAAMDSESLNEKRAELTDFRSEEMAIQAAALGITLEQAQLRDLTFPKSVQDLFAKHLEAKIRAKSELENARTAVATARALKNASELMKDDDNLRFFQMVEMLTKIAEKGKHTFMIGDMQQLMKK